MNASARKSRDFFRNLSENNVVKAKGGEFLKKLWCRIGGGSGNKHFVLSVLFSSDVSSVSYFKQDNGKFGALPSGRKENRPRSISWAWY